MVLAFVLWVLGIASVVYFGAYAFIIGLNNSFTYFWLLLGVNSFEDVSQRQTASA